MSITHNSNIVLDIEPAGVSGLPGLVVHRLRFSVKYRVPARGQIFIAANFRALVSVSKAASSATAYLGVAWPENAWTVRSHPVTQNSTILFDYDLNGEQLAMIENVRSGGDLAFTLQVHCAVAYGEDFQAGRDEVRFSVNRSSWIEVMKQFGVDRLVLLEVVIPAGSKELETATSLLKRAREELDAGNYDGAVQQCRRAMESVEKTLKLGPAGHVAIDSFCKGERKKMSKQMRALLVNEAVLHYAHLAHHVDENGETFDYGRRDAAFMLALASAVVANASSFAAG